MFFIIVRGDDWLIAKHAVLTWCDAMRDFGCRALWRADDEEVVLFFLTFYQQSIRYLSFKHSFKADTVHAALTN